MKDRKPLMYLHYITNLTLVFIAGFLMIFSTCKPPKNQNQEKQQQQSNDQKEDLIRRQQDIVKDENEEIESFITRRQYQMTVTQTGLRYMIYHSGAKSRPVKDDDIVILNYNISMLDGTPVYSSVTEGDLEMKVGKSEVASGLQEGLKYMHEGDKAIMVIPSHLAYGLTGDGDRIKQYQVLVVDVEVKKIR